MEIHVLAGPEDVVAVCTLHLSGPHLLRVVGGQEVVYDDVHIHLQKEWICHSNASILVMKPKTF